MISKILKFSFCILTLFFAAWLCGCASDPANSPDTENSDLTSDPAPETQLIEIKNGMFIGQTGYMQNRFVLRWKILYVCNLYRHRFQMLVVRKLVLVDRRGRML